MYFRKVVEIKFPSSNSVVFDEKTFLDYYLENYVKNWANVLES